MLFRSNSFTPDNDGENEVFYAYGTGVRFFEMKIFDRWGEMVFESTDITVGWDGKFAGHAVHDGIYICVVRFSMDGNRVKLKKGSVALIR